MATYCNQHEIPALASLSGLLYSVFYPAISGVFEVDGIFQEFIFAKVLKEGSRNCQESIHMKPRAEI